MGGGGGGGGGRRGGCVQVFAESGLCNRCPVTVRDFALLGTGGCSRSDERSDP